MERELSGNEKALAATGNEFQEGAKDANRRTTWAAGLGSWATAVRGHTAVIFSVYPMRVSPFWKTRGIMVLHWGKQSQSQVLCRPE